MKAHIACNLFLLLLAAVPSIAKDIHATIIYDDVATSLTAAREDADQLWITTGDLKRATRFEVKPQGVCRNELCFPLPKARQQDFLHKESGTSWFNLTAFAALVH